MTQPPKQGSVERLMKTEPETEAKTTTPESPIHDLQQPVTTVMRTDVTCLQENLTVQKALEQIRSEGLGEKIVYFYVVDSQDRLVGVMPTRRLLTAPLQKHLREIMISHVIAIPHTATILEACEQFLMYRFLAFPVVDEQRRVLGVVDVTIFTQSVINVAEREHADQIFEIIGFRISQIQRASPFRSFKIRFPWLTATIGTGLLCALLTSMFEKTLAQALELAFFLTLVLGLGESISIQAMTLAIQALHAVRPTWRWFLRSWKKELQTAALLGSTAGILVGLVSWLWKGSVVSATTIGGGIFLAMCGAGTIGLTIPSILHALRVDPKVASGPLALALTDLCTLTFYLTLGKLSLLLR